MESQSGELLQPPEGVEDGPVGQLVTVEVEQPGGRISQSPSDQARHQVSSTPSLWGGEGGLRC